MAGCKKCMPIIDLQRNAAQDAVLSLSRSASHRSRAHGVHLIDGRRAPQPALRDNGYQRCTSATEDEVGPDRAAGGRRPHPRGDPSEGRAHGDRGGACAHRTDYGNVAEDERSSTRNVERTPVSRARCGRSTRSDTEGPLRRWCRLSLCRLSAVSRLSITPDVYGVGWEVSQRVFRRRGASARRTVVCRGRSSRRRGSFPTRRLPHLERAGAAT